MDLLLLSLAQLAAGFVIACTALIVGVIFVAAIREYLGLNKQPVEHMYEFDKAELRTGGWQYYDLFFNKMEEFRNDFA